MRIAHRRGESVGEVVRQAIAASCQTEEMGLSLPQRQALEACRGGFIGLGKLSESMGMDILGLRRQIQARKRCFMHFCQTRGAA